MEKNRFVYISKWRTPTTCGSLKEAFFSIFWTGNMHRASSVQTFIFQRQSRTIMFKKDTGKYYRNEENKPPFPQLQCSQFARSFFRSLNIANGGNGGNYFKLAFVFPIMSMIVSKFQGLSHYPGSLFTLSFSRKDLRHYTACLFLFRSIY